MLSDQVTVDDVNHELSHAIADAFGYGRGWASVEAENEYERRLMQGERDPFVANDPTNDEYLLSHENGESVGAVPEEMETLIEETNRTWQRIQRHYQTGGVDEAEDYTIRNNYSSTGASEVFAQLNEVMQSDAPPMEPKKYETHATLIEAYCQLFVPSEIVQGFLDDIGIQTGDEQ